MLQPRREQLHRQAGGIRRICQGGVGIGPLLAVDQPASGLLIQVAMDKPLGHTELRILMLEDVPTDAELAEISLREAGLSFIAKRVDTRETFILALEDFKPDIVLADYNLPAFDGGSAVKLVRQQHPEVPVV